MNKRIRTGLVSTALVAGSLIGAGVVSAQVDDTVPSDTAETTIEQPADETPSDEASADGQNEERAERRAERAERRAARAQATADLLGIDVDELRAAFQEGQTLAQLAEANGVDVQTIIDAHVATATERINAAVEAGRLTADEAADKLAELEARVTTRINEGRPERGDRGGRGHRDGRGEGPAADAATAGEQGA